MNFKYINKYSTQAAYDAANKFYPNTSYIEATDEIVYAERDPNLMVAKFTTTSANQSIRISGRQQNFSSITVEGVDQTIGTGVLNYTFATAGEHEVTYRLINNGTGLYMAFQSCSQLTSILLPETVTTISQYAFENCNNLTSLTIPNSVTTIGNSSIWGCTSLTSITIPSSVTRIDNGGIGGCTALTSVTIPSSVTRIDDNPFYDSTNITSITVDSGNTYFNDGNGSNCIINTSNKLISGCKNTVIPNTVTSIGNTAFRIMGLTGALNIPASVTSIGNQAFMNNTGITSITCNATTPPTLGSNVFMNISATCPIYVPAASVDTYKAASGWSERASYIQAIS